MAHKVEFTKADKVNGIEYAKGDMLNVSASIYKKLNETGSIKDFVEPKPAKKEKE